jgi:hypothetical protein
MELEHNLLRQDDQFGIRVVSVTIHCVMSSPYKVCRNGIHVSCNCLPVYREKFVASRKQLNSGDKGNDRV